MWNAYGDFGLLVLVYCVCPQCRIPIDLSVWPTYELLQVLHFNLYMPLEFIVFSGIVSRCGLYMVVLVRKAILQLVLLNKSVTLCMSGL